MTTVELEHKLRNLPDLPVPVRAWRVETGCDATGDEAVWVWATLPDTWADRATRSQLRLAIREAVAGLTQDARTWVYVRFRGESEAEPQ
jgi:hypothetical protein